MRYLILLASLAATPLLAQDLRDGEAVLDAQDMAREVQGTTHTFFDGGQSFFSITDSYTYTYPDGGVAYGRYEIREGGVVCTFFNHGFERCDTYIRSGERLVLINEEGVRFPVKAVDGEGSI